MYARHIHIDTNCDAGQCGQECVHYGSHVFQIDPNHNRAIVIASQPLQSTDEEEAGFAIQHCPRAAIWGRGQGEAIGGTHRP